MRVIFMGTPEFAVPSLRALIDGPDDVVAVITQPDRPKGRHGVPTPPPVKVLAQKHNIAVYQPEKVKDKAFLPQLKALNPDVIVVVAYGQILSREILEVPPKWCINIHASLLPKYRGSAPINWALINGETVTGVTSMIVSAALDSGPILLKKEVSIGDDDDVSMLHEKLSTAGGKLLSETMDRIRKGDLTPVPQNESEATYFPMLEKSDGLIDWHRKAEEIRNRIKGLNPWPGTYTYLSGAMLKIYKADIWTEPTPPNPLSTSTPLNPLFNKEGKPTGRGVNKEGVPKAGALVSGTVLDVNNEGITVATGDGYLSIRELQLEGKRKMTVSEFIRGHKIEKGMVLGS